MALTKQDRNEGPLTPLKPSVKVRRVSAQPSAAILIESMRDVGYTLETALADIVDNAIAAGAASIRILADTSSASPSVAIADDGTGMDYDELIDAMRLGNRSPLDHRQASDLGRFGLGLQDRFLLSVPPTYRHQPKRGRHVNRSMGP